MARRIIETGIIAIVSSFISNELYKSEGIVMKFLYEHLWVGIWPIWVGLAAAVVYWIVRLLIDLYKMERAYKNDLSEMKKEIRSNAKKTIELVNQVYEEVSEWRETAETIMEKYRGLEKTIKELKDGHVLEVKTGGEP